MRKNKYLIIGGVAGGASAATRLRRDDEDAEIIMIERDADVSYANCGLPYYLGGVITDRDRLNVATPEFLRTRFKIDVRTQTEALKIIPGRHQVKLKDLTTGREYTESFNKLLLATGSRAFVPPIPGIDSPGCFVLKTLADTDKVKAYYDEHQPKSITVIGGGPIGIEIAENYIGLGLAVTIVEAMPQIMGMFDIELANKLTSHLRDKGIRIILNSAVEKVTRDEAGLELTLAKAEPIRTDLVFVVAGIRSESTLAQAAGLTTLPTGAIHVNSYLTTSHKDILAVGDAIAVTELVTQAVLTVALAGPANKQGRIAADNMSGQRRVYNGALASAILKVCDLTAASTGLSEAQAKRAGLDCLSATIHTQDHAGYYPGSKPLTLKLVFTKEGKLIGAQSVGYGGVDKRIDVIATAMRSGQTVDDLADLDLCYAPPYSSAKDPVNMVGFVAQNIIAGRLKPFYASELAALKRSEWYILDVRTQAEREIGAIPGSHHIELDALRSNVHRLAKDKQYLVYCASGQRSYLAARILLQKGYDAFSLIGGYHTYKDLVLEPTQPALPVAQPQDNAIARAQLLSQDAKPAASIDATGLMCPGPLGLVFKNMKLLSPGEILAIKATDPAFKTDVAAWCKSTGNELLSVDEASELITARIQKGQTDHSRQIETSDGKAKTIVVFSDDIDRVIAAFFIANGAAGMGRDVTMFFTFWGLNILRKPGSVSVKKDLISQAFGRMMPKGSQHLHLSQLNMGGAGTQLIRWLMIKKHIGTLESIIAQAQESGVHMIACSTSMDIMGIKAEEFIDGVTIGGVATYLGDAEESDTNLFI